MGQRLKSNFNKRFNNRISIIYPDKPLSPSDQRLQSERIYKAFKDVLSGILNREPTEAELFGVVDIRKFRVKRR